MSSRDRSRRRVLSRDERVLWQNFTRSIEPLRASTLVAPEAEQEDGAPRGREVIDARIDLHGLTQAQAHSALLHFLREASARDKRLVLVITGKGSRTAGARGDGKPGVLKRQVPQWLGLPEFRKLVIGFEDAHIAHGGEGAIYVRIRKSKGR
ncbi:MAG: Smr/MutS family protein [Pseudolabrys sp.]